MKKVFHKADAYFALLLAFFFGWYSVLNMVYVDAVNWLNIGRAAMTFLFIFIMMEVMFVLISFVRGKALMGNARSQYFSWQRVLPIALFMSGANTLFELQFVWPPSRAIVVTMLLGFVIGTGLTMLYFYTLVDKHAAEEN